MGDYGKGGLAAMFLENELVHTHGYVRLIDKMGDDAAVVDAARISYDRRGRHDDRNLIRYLMRHRHTTPFEMAVLKFEVKMPIFVARQWIRHRTASINEVSARYTQLPSEMFIPKVVSIQSDDNKQGRGDDLDRQDQREARRHIRTANVMTYEHYEDLLDIGVAREMARGVLPLNIYTKFIWKMDLHNLMHFLNLRLDPHAQQEIRDYAQRIEQMVFKHFPVCHEAFVDYVRDAYTCSKMEVEVLRGLLRFYMHEQPNMEDDDAQARLVRLDGYAGQIMTKRELREFRERFMPNE
jgi:thymidylate synthase (FAD)